MKESREPLLQGAARGTAYHRILECLDYAKADSQQAIEQQIEELLQKEKISKEAAKVVRSSQISWFVRSAVGKRMKEAFVLGTLHREQQFVMSIDASERNPRVESGRADLVQGIIDAFWEEADAWCWWIINTDHVKEGQELIDRYQRQMHYYSQALERAYGKKVKECYLYSFALEKRLLWRCNLRGAAFCRYLEEVLRYFKDSQDLLTSNIIRCIVLNAKQHTVGKRGKGMSGVFS